MRKINIFIGKLENLCVGIAGFALLLLMVLTTVDTIMRYFFSEPLVGVVEFSEEVLMVAIIYMPMSYVFLQGGHIKVELLERFFPDRLKVVFGKMHQLIGLILFLLITYFSIPVAYEAIVTNELSAAALPFPMAPSYVMLTLGCAMLCLRSLELIFGWIEIEDHDDNHH